MKHCLALLLAASLVLGILSGCAAKPVPAEEPVEVSVPTEEPEPPQAEEPPTEPVEPEAPEEPEEPAEPEEEPLLVVIDPGHQGQGDSTPEPIGPGASETKAKVASGTRGTTTGIPEYELTLAVSLLLRDELEARGYEVLMTRETHDVNLSNAERAEIANEAEADAFLRIHANGSTDPSIHGIMTICMTPQNAWNAALYEESRALSDAVLSAASAATGAAAQSVWETDTMSGINWCQVPVTIVEMGYLTNPEEDRLLSDPAYQEKMAAGIADGVDQYFAAQSGTETDDGRDAALQALLDDQLLGLSSSWDVYAESLDSGAWASAQVNHAAGEGMVSASLIKLFILGAVYDQVNRGILSADAVYSDAYSMITISDNGAANRLTRLLGGGDAAAGMAAVTEFAAAMGCEAVSLNRLMLENNGLENYVTAADCARILRAIYRGECVSPEYSEIMLDMLRDQTVNNRIPQGLSGGASAAHKTGDLSGLSCGDVGIVFSDAGDYLLCVICNHPYTDSGAASKIVDITRAVHQYMTAGA